MSRIRSAAAPAAVALLAASVLAGCAHAPSPMPVPTYAPTATATLAPGEEVLPDGTPVFRPGGTALQNQRVFDDAIEQYRAANGVGTADALVATLVGVGFDQAAMEVTPEYTAIGLAADSIVVAVLIQGECLVGQVFADHTVGVIAPVLGMGRCLVGETHPIG